MLRIALAAALLTSGIIQAEACSGYFTCGDFKVCFEQGVQNDIDRIREGARTGNGHLAWEGGDACWTNFDKNHQHNYNEWKGHTAGCSDDNFAQFARAAVSGSCPPE